jgi:large subunit ribosomal protein L10
MQIAKKHEVVAELSEKLSDAKCLYLTDFTGLDVAAITELRRRLTAARVDYLVVKNTLARRALAGGPYEGLAEHLSGPNAFALSREDVVTAAKILTDFAKEREKPQIRAGAIEGRVVSIDEIRRIAELPPRDQLLAQVVGTVRAPIAGLVYTLSGLLSKFVRTVDAVRQQKAAQGPSAE